MHISIQYVPWKIANVAESRVLQALQFQQMGFCRKLPASQDRRETLQT
jgi:hypothetical protein